MAAVAPGLSADESKLFRVQKTCWKMLRKRGYNVDDTYINMSTAEFTTQYGNNPSRERLTILVQRIDDPEDQLYIFFPEGDKDDKGEKIGVTHLKKYYGRMKDDSVFRAIIVVRNNLTPIARQLIKEIASRGFRMEYFREAELLVDITEHKLVPEHVVLSDQQKKELLDRYRLKPSQLPRIQVTDPVARYLGLKPHQVVKIIRPSETAGRYITYRICI
jgi:DNA-directed RNA polymerase I, II, and III subunit RPABC1